MYYLTPKCFITLKTCILNVQWKKIVHCLFDLFHNIFIDVLYNFCTFHFILVLSFTCGEIRNVVKFCKCYQKSKGRCWSWSQVFWKNTVKLIDYYWLIKQIDIFCWLQSTDFPVFIHIYVKNVLMKSFEMFVCSIFEMVALFSNQVILISYSL